MLRIYTVVWGVLGTLTGLAMIQVRTALETGWQLAGIAGGGLVGLFLLALLSRRVKPWQAAIAVLASIMSIFWATFARELPREWDWFECAWHSRMIGVIGTVTLLTVGFGLAVLTVTGKKDTS